MNLINELRQRRAQLRLAMDAIITGAEREGRGLSVEQDRDFRAKAKQAGELDDRIEELLEAEAREASAAAHRVETGTDVTTRDGHAPNQAASSWRSRARVGREAGVYRPDVPEVSFFKDLVAARSGDYEAAQRLHRNNQMNPEYRALSTTTNAGGQFAPPLWLVDEFVELARPGRVTADLLHREDLPFGVSSVNLPTVATGTSEAVQASQNTSVSMTDITTGSVSSGITTIAGQQQISQQLLDQSGIPFDRVIMTDLARANAVALDGQVLNGSGASGQLAGILGTAGVNSVTYTDASPAVVGVGKFLSKVLTALNAVATTRFLPADAIVMHPTRWAWVLDATDTTNRPLVVPNGASYNPVGTSNGQVQAGGPAGTLFGTPVYVDPNIPTNQGAGTNQDAVLVLRRDDLWLWESAPFAQSFDAPYANQLTVLFRLHSYAALIANRQPKGIALITGTGLVTPTL